MMDNQEKIEKWENFRLEMKTHESRLAGLAKNFLELGAFEDSAKCSIKAEGIKYVLARMPQPPQHKDDSDE
jgi:hypothetical protein